MAFICFEEKEKNQGRGPGRQGQGLYVHCLHLRTLVWAKVLSKLNAMWVTPQIFLGSIMVCVNTEGRLLWRIASLAAFWALG